MAFLNQKDTVSQRGSQVTSLIVKVNLNTGADKLFVQVNPPTVNMGKICAKYEIVRENAKSIRNYGVQEYAHDSTMLIDEKLAVEIADKIIEKYRDGLSYINAEWKGNAELEPGEIFTSFDLREKQKAAIENRDPVKTLYECLSNEVKFDGGYKQTTKARQSNST